MAGTKTRCVVDASWQISQRFGFTRSWPRSSWFMMRGGDLLALQKILGHRTLAMTQKYAHLSPDYLRSAMERTAGTPTQDPVAFSTCSAQESKIEAQRLVTPHAPVAQVDRASDF